MVHLSFVNSIYITFLPPVVVGRRRACVMRRDAIENGKSAPTARDTGAT
jgi:hypothetical protein